MISHRHSGPRALLAAAILTLAAVPARADHSVGVVVTGEATMQPQLVAQLETWLRTHGHELVSAALPPDAINALIDCFVIEDPGCARKVVEKRAKSKAVVFAQVSVTTGATALDRTVTLTAHWLDKGKDARSERRLCERCSDASMRNAADELMTALAGPGSSEGRLKLASTPPGAKVKIDLKAVGKTPLDHSVSPGDHNVVFELEDRPAQTRTISVKKGEILTVEVAFGPRPPRPSRALAFAALAGGVALGAAGGVMYAIDEDVPLDPTDPEYLDTAPAGVALVASGAVVIGVGVYLLVRKPSKPSPSSAPTAALLPGGGTVGWAGRF